MMIKVEKTKLREIIETQKKPPH